MKRVAIYCRVSTNDQSCERQLVELREVAKNHNWEIVKEYVENGVSGAKTSRPQLNAMMKDAFSRKFEMVMTLELTRIGRNTKQVKMSIATRLVQAIRLCASAFSSAASVSLIVFTVVYSSSLTMPSPSKSFIQFPKQSK